MISYVIGHKNRLQLFSANLQTLLQQTSKNFEVVVVDGSDEANFQQLKKMVTEFRSAGMEISVCKIDPSRHPMSHAAGEYGGAYNPALAQNIGVRRSRGDVICLTSPEVINACTNVERAEKIFSDGASRFLLGWIDERPIGQIGQSARITVEQMKSLCVRPGNGAMCRSDVPSRPWLPINYFLGFLRRDDFIKIGGIDERFMFSIGWEDNFFAECLRHAGMPAVLDESIAGIHLTHSRGYQMAGSNESLWNQIKSETVANKDLAWGDFRYIVEEF